MRLSPRRRRTLDKLIEVLRLLAEDADEPWRNATSTEVAAENARRRATDRRELRR